MALVKAEDVVTPTRGFFDLTLLRQLGLMAGLAASVAVGVAAVLWSQSPSYRMLYSGLVEDDVASVAASLEKAGIPYELSDGASTILVPAEHVHQARLKLAGEGLPKGLGVGFELLEEQKGFGVSQFMENARYQRALEGELARTISSINSVRGARVHLAIPRESAFLRNRKKPTASVTVDLYPGRTLQGEQVAAIGHMVAASIPNLEVNQVTIIDQQGRLLTSPDSSEQMRLTSTQFDHRKRLEEYFKKRIEDLLTPIVGVGSVRAQVTADIDFTVSEHTQESFNPDLPAIRSEQTIEEQAAGSLVAAGIPGSASNQPDAVGKADESSQGLGGNSVRRATRNYELDKTISHVKNGGGTVRQLSVAVVLDDKQEIDEDGEIIRTPYSPEEIARFTELVKETVGYDDRRGDRINVVNAAFTVPPEPEPLPEPSMLESGGLWNVVKQILAIGAVAFLIFGVLKPVLRSLAEKGRSARPVFSGQGGLAEDQLMLSGAQAGMALPSAASYESNLTTARNLATQDPKRVAQVVNNWVSTE